MIAVTVIVLFIPGTHSIQQLFPSANPYLSKAQMSSLFGSGGVYGVSVSATTPAQVSTYLKNNPGFLPPSYTGGSGSVTGIWGAAYNSTINVTSATFVTNLAIRLNTPASADSFYAEALKQTNQSSSAAVINKSMNGALYSTLFINYSSNGRNSVMTMVLAKKGDEIGAVFAVSLNRSLTDLNSIINTLTSDLS